MPSHPEVRAKIMSALQQQGGRVVASDYQELRRMLDCDELSMTSFKDSLSGLAWSPTDGHQIRITRDRSEQDLHHSCPIRISLRVKPDAPAVR